MQLWTFLVYFFAYIVLLFLSAVAIESSNLPFSKNMTSNDGPYSPQVALDIDSYPVAPPELSLEQVQVYIRHGERTPVRVRMSDPPASIPAHWTFCRTARQFHAAVTTFGEAVRDSPRSSDGVDFLPVKRIVERADGTVIDGECLLGELTDIGRQSTYNYGRSLRKLYIDKSTNMPRTIESLQQIVHGLYPRSKLAHGIAPRIRVRNGVDENLIPNTYSCPRLEQLLISFAKAAAGAYNHTLELLDGKLSKYIGGRPIRIDGQPRASGILDTIKASKANGIEVPSEFEDKQTMDLLEKAVVAEWFADKTEEPRRLGMGRLLDDLSRKTLKASQPSALQTSSSGRVQSPAPRILMHSTHDTALAALLSTLDVFDERWPPFTASVTFELFRRIKPADDTQTSYLQTVLTTLSPFRKASRPSEHFVRIRYQNQNMVLPFCADKGNHLKGHPEFCTLAVFQERVRTLVPENWESACEARPT